MITSFNLLWSSKVDPENGNKDNLEEDDSKDDGDDDAVEDKVDDDDDDQQGRQD